jgi:hypothetical protein
MINLKRKTELDGRKAEFEGRKTDVKMTWDAGEEA